MLSVQLQLRALGKRPIQRLGFSLLFCVWPRAFIYSTLLKSCCRSLSFPHKLFLFTNVRLEGLTNDLGSVAASLQEES